MFDNYKYKLIYSITSGVGRSKRNLFHVLQNTYIKISFLDKKNLGDRLCFKDDTKFLFSFF